MVPTIKTSAKQRVRKNRAVLSEDEADHIISERRMRDEGPGVTIHDYLREHGYAVEYSPESKRAKRIKIIRLVRA